jgi:hypothetical protein
VALLGSSCGAAIRSRARPTLTCVSSYVRPAVVEQACRDADGAVIEYGNRWGSEGPAEDSYSVDTHPERFAALHQIADALIDYLQRSYQVQVTDDLGCVQDLRRPRADALRAVRLVPAAADAAVLTFVLTAYPGVVVHAGLLNDFVYPGCGCDACDETWQSVADELEWTVQAVVSGGYREEVRGIVGEPWIWHRLMAEDGSHNASGGTIADAGADAALRAAAARLAELPGGWAAWPRREITRR